jgi:DNA polymerase III epsilon subunit-like protein
MEDGRLVRSHHWILAPAKDDRGRYRRRYEIASLEVSGITWKQILAGTPINQALDELREFANLHDAHELPVVAYNASFDFAMYTDQLFLCGCYDRSQRRFHAVRPPMVGPWICARLAAQAQLDLPDYKLDTVAAHFGMKRPERNHDALADAILTGQVFHKLRLDRQARAGPLPLPHAPNAGSITAELG